MISLLAGIMVFCTVFSIVPQLIDQAATDPAVLDGLGSLKAAVDAGETFSPQLLQKTIFDAGNEGITFTWMPQLFKSMPAGQFFMTLFFTALVFAAFTSLLAMVELATRALVDGGVSRSRAIQCVGLGGFLLGVPSALSMKFLQNQDWVWGVALMLAGLFFAIAIIAHGARKFRIEQLNHADSNVRVGRWWDVVICILVPIQAVILLAWLLYDAWSGNPENWLKPFDVYNVGTVLIQFVVVLVVLILANKWIVRRCNRPDGENVQAG
ncbi:MAG: sodium-dependent transporter [Planctomycetes bacterium]|nr:sodium-dependent transporter [Planctomycetota bacterium]